ncbi:hypothetical protein SAMN04487958_103141 [Vreelandella subterranea]|uniref:Protein refolding chaperone Spy/CpxP family n=1 Tax=Vreelandella subterranea TaxID=416874 RepID=A0A1H9SA56_9GAMM|nr:hypothetical protein [Halomonas subterranea]SER81798.1 hypothetical protein SAMN04487958_103141 [Halomonas subterranea]
MTLSLRQFVAPALFAAVLLPLAATAQADHHNGEKPHHDRVRMEERMKEHRQDVYERAALSEDKQQALNEAHETFRDEMKDVRDAHQTRMTEILTEDEQEALRNAMHEAREEYRQGHGKRHHGDEDASQ